MKIVVYYKIKNKTSFSKRVIPYIYGLGEYRPEFITDTKWISKKKLKATINTKSVSQLTDATIGMLRFSSGSFLENIEIEECSHINKELKLFQNNEAIIGAILKPALADIKAHYRIIKSVFKLGFDFIKDDDVIEFSDDRVKKIYKYCGKKIAYFHKTSNQKQFTNLPTMIIPWIDGWSLVEEFSKNKKAPLMTHCANMPLQISWSSHIVLSRLAGADFIIVPDSKFDKTANLKEMIEAVSRKIKNLPSTRIIIAGAITPKRIEEIKKSINKKFHKFIGFAIGSWLIRI
ncbi:hypothetical protein KKA23_01360 [Patescibacteria group bacterium]|nr:hypothetical protein [Patescibacteria group bacterium]